MKAVIQNKYGPPDVLQIRNLEIPEPKDNEVRINFKASTVTAVDCTFRKGKPFIGRFFSGLFKPKNQIPGTEFAGVVDKIGKAVKHFAVGDRVLGTTLGNGAYAEYICLPEDESTLAIMPVNMTFEEAACCDGAITALPFLKEAGKIKAGHRVLIYGASGSVGTAAVQLAKYFGAEVTGVCSTSNLKLVKSIGADCVIDYKNEDFTKNNNTYDIIFDTVGKCSYSYVKKSLTRNGIFLETVLSAAIISNMFWTAKFGSRKAKILFTGLQPPSKRTNDLKILNQIIEEGKMISVIDRSYSLEEIADAQRYVEKGHKKGNVVIKICD